MKALVLLALLLAAGAVQAAAPVATSYIRITVEPDFQYRSDQDVVIPVQVRAVRGGVPQGDHVRLEVRDASGQLYDVAGSQEGFQNGVAPYPHVVYVNLGRLPVGLYRATFHAWTGDLQRDWLTEFDVIYP